MVNLFCYSSLFLRSLGTVFGTALHPSGYTCCIECTSDDVISHTREVLDSAASDKYHAVLLKIMSDTRDISGDFDPVCETYPRDLSESGIRLLRSDCLYGSADSSLLR